MSFPRVLNSFCKQYPGYLPFSQEFSSLKSLPLQRNLCSDKISQIRSYLQSPTSVVGALLIGFHANSFYLLDGYHRLEALKQCPDKSFTVIIYEVSHYHVLEQIFRAHNQLTPVSDYLLLENSLIREIYKEFELRLVQKYGPRIKLSKVQAQRPVLQMEEFWKSFQHDPVVQSVKTVDDLLVRFQQFNHYFQEIFRNPQIWKSYEINENLYRKAEENQFWIGLLKHQHYHRISEVANLIN